MFADPFSGGRTAGSFGGLRMTVKRGGVIPRPPPHHCHPEASEGSGCWHLFNMNLFVSVIPRHPRDLVFLYL
jgi:hypothetical protein